MNPEIAPVPTRASLRQDSRAKSRRGKSRPAKSQAGRSGSGKSGSGQSGGSQPGQSRLNGESAPKLIAAIVALAGAVLVAFAALQVTLLKAPVSTHAVLTSPQQSVVTTAVGVLGLDGPRLQVDATSNGARRPVFIGIGRAHDVDAYLAGVSRQEIIGQDGSGTLLSKRLGTDASLPDPAGADVWVVSVRGRGSASIAWPDAPGQWRLVVASDGTAPAAGSLAFTWSGAQRHTSAPALIAIGIVLIVGGLMTLVMLSSRARLDGEEA